MTRLGWIGYLGCVTTMALLSGCCSVPSSANGGLGHGPVPMGSPSACGRGCADGCGERYWGEWISTPPCADPCDSCGNYNGPVCGPGKPLLSVLKNLWGYRYNPMTCEVGCDTQCGTCQSCSMGNGMSYQSSYMGASSGCSSCGSGGTTSHPMMMPGEIIQPQMSTPQRLEPTPASPVQQTSATRISPAAQKLSTARRTTSQVR